MAIGRAIGKAFMSNGSMRFYPYLYIRNKKDTGDEDEEKKKID